jgi:hypothetical protein
VKKEKIIILFIFLFLFSTICNSQTNDSILIKKDLLHYRAGNAGVVYNLIYTIINNQHSPLYLWIEQDTHSSDFEKVKDYFFIPKGDMNFYSMAVEANVAYYSCSVFSSFLKKINPNESFSIYVISEKNFLDCEKKHVFNFLDEHCVIMEETILEKYLQSLSVFNPLIFYKNDFIILPIFFFGMQSSPQKTNKE